MIRDNLMAEEELEYRAKESELTPEHLKSLLIKSGVPEGKAESARAKMALNLARQKNGLNK